MKLNLFFAGFYITFVTMELTLQDIKRIMLLEKHAGLEELVNEELVLNLSYPIKREIKLFSPAGDIEFRWVIKQSSKLSFKLTLHIMERENNTGLFRLDYCSDAKVHVNPVVANESVPSDVSCFAGVDIRGSHAHFSFPGYNELAWAVPIKGMSAFPDMFDGKQSSIEPIILTFAKYVNVVTHIICESPVL